MLYWSHYQKDVFNYTDRLISLTFVNNPAKHLLNPPTLSFQSFQSVLGGISVLPHVRFDCSICGQHNCPLFLHSWNRNRHCNFSDSGIGYQLHLIDHQLKFKTLLFQICHRPNYSLEFLVSNYSYFSYKLWQIVQCVKIIQMCSFCRTILTLKLRPSVPNLDFELVSASYYSAVAINKRFVQMRLRMPNFQRILICFESQFSNLLPGLTPIWLWLFLWSTCVIFLDLTC